MKTIEIKNVPVSSNPHGIETRKFHENEHVQAVHITLKPGEKLKKHILLLMSFFMFWKEQG
jgi:hypothetical protein